MTGSLHVDGLMTLWTGNDVEVDEFCSMGTGRGEPVDGVEFWGDSVAPELLPTLFFPFFPPLFLPRVLNLGRASTVNDVCNYGKGYGKMYCM